MQYQTPIEDPVPDKPKIALQRRKRGPKKTSITKQELEMRALTPKMRDLAEGRLKVEDLDWDELIQGRLKGVNGKFTGAAPAILPRIFHERIAQEIIVRAESRFRENFDDAMRALIGIMNDPRAASRERLAASQYVIERIIGKIPDKAEVKQTITVFDQLVQSGELLIDLGEHKDDVIEEDPLAGL